MEKVPKNSLPPSIKKATKNYITEISTPVREWTNAGLLNPTITLTLACPFTWIKVIKLLNHDYGLPLF